VTSISEIHIQGTDTDPVLRAQVTLQVRNAEMLADLAAKVALATELALSPVHREQAREALAEFCSGPLLRHLQTADQVLYAVAAGAAETRLLVRALRIQHGLVADRVTDLNRADSADEVATAAHALGTLLGACQLVEQKVLVPALAVLPGADLPALVEDVSTLLDGGVLETPEVLDVREIPHGRRHPRIFGTYARLTPGRSFVLVNNHDPKPLRREFQATFPDQFGWDYLETGPDRWQVRISVLPGHG
jgi:uncharacterized protein (DUF2249 family)